MKKTLIQLGATFMFFGVAFGAFGAHALKARLPADMLAIWKTGVDYQLVHGLALLIVALFPESKFTRAAGGLFSAGILVFSGSLYVLAVTQVKVLGAITPLGGVCFLAGWLALILSARASQN